MTSIRDIPTEILALIFKYQPNWFLPILSLVSRRFYKAVALRPEKHEMPTYEKIAGVGWLLVLQWLRSQSPPCPWDATTCAAAAEGGHHEVLKWAREQDPPCPWDEETCSAAAEGGHLKVLKWARNQDPPCPWDAWTCRWAAKGGHLEVLQWAREYGCPV